MAEDKTHDPTPHRLREARERGEVPRSQDVVTALVTAAGLGTFSIAWEHVVTGARNLVAYGATSMAHAAEGDPRLAMSGLTTAAIPLLLWSATVPLVVVVSAFVTGLAQTTGLVSLSPLAPQFSRVNPLEGIKRMFSARGAGEHVKVLLKALALVVVAVLTCRSESHRLLALGEGQLVSVVSVVVGAGFRLAWKLVATVAVISVLDYAWQRRTFMKGLRMSLQEIKDEYRSHEGDPHIKARRRQLQRAMAKKASLQNVRKARVVVANPTHFAVALQYGGGETEVPLVLVKGSDHRAIRIKELARLHGVEVVESPALARALHASVEEGHYIPQSLYLATAHVLVMVAQLEEQARKAKGRI